MFKSVLTSQIKKAEARIGKLESEIKELRKYASVEVPVIDSKGERVEERESYTSPLGRTVDLGMRQKVADVGLQDLADALEKQLGVKIYKEEIPAVPAKSSVVLYEGED